MTMNIRTLRLMIFLWCATATQQTTYPCNSNDSCGCSANSATVNARIVDGETAASNTWSWAVSLELGDSLCGGSIISDSYIMTAGHCVQGESASSITAYVGSTIILKGQPKSVSRVYQHPDYYEDPDGRFVLNDVALLKLSTRLDMNDRTLALACLPKNDIAPPNNKDLIGIGWGTTFEGSPRPIGNTTTSDAEVCRLRVRLGAQAWLTMRRYSFVPGSCQQVEKVGNCVLDSKMFTSYGF